MRAGMDRHDAGLTTVVPIYLSKCNWSDAPFSELSALPSRDKPLTKWIPRAKAYAVIAAALSRLLAKHSRTQRSRSQSRSSSKASLFYARGMKRLRPLVEQNAMFSSTTRRIAAQATAAIRDFDRAISLEPTGERWATWNYYHRGLAQFCRKNLNAAIADFSRAINIAPANAFAYRKRAIAFDGAEDHRRALRDYSRAIRTPSVGKAYFNRGLLYRSSAETKAAADFRTLKVGNDPAVERDAKKQLSA
jgi:tetratricopeptide (TPR) repeat protein